MGVPSDGHRIDFAAQDQMIAEFHGLNPNTKIPAIIDPHGPDSQPPALFESSAILIYLAEKSGKFPPAANRYAVLQWLMFQTGGVGPVFGQLGIFHIMAGKEIEDPRPNERYRAENARLIKVLKKVLEGRDWIARVYSIADMALGPWLGRLRDFYKAGDITGLNDAQNIGKYINQYLARRAVQHGLTVPGKI